MDVSPPRSTKSRYSLRERAPVRKPAAAVAARGPVAVSSSSHAPAPRPISEMAHAELRRHLIDTTSCTHMVWLGTLGTPDEYTEMADALRQMLGCIHPVHITGATTTLHGRHDIHFTISSADEPRVAVTRLAHDDIKWLCDYDQFC